MTLENKKRNKTSNNLKGRCGLSHGYSYTHLYRVYANMIERCNPIHIKRFPRYSGRGITVCDEWQNNKVSFFKWAESNGYVKGLHLDRTDNNGNYCPENCRFVIPKTNLRNRNNAIIVEYKGETKLLLEWCEELGIDYTKTYSRIAVSKWSVEDAFTKPNYTVVNKCVNKKKPKEYIKNGRPITIDGQTKPFAEWCRTYGVKYTIAYTCIISRGQDAKTFFTKYKTTL